jgi:hypothetical protein
LLLGGGSQGVASQIVASQIVASQGVASQIVVSQGVASQIVASQAVVSHSGDKSDSSPLAKGKYPAKVLAPFGKAQALPKVEAFFTPTR